MASVYYVGDAEVKKRQYINNVEVASSNMRKNFKDMDLENASVQKEIELIVEKMRRECDSLITTLRGI